MSPRQRSSCAARAELPAGFKQVAPGEVLIVFVVVPRTVITVVTVVLLVPRTVVTVEFDLDVELEVSPRHRSSCAARAELPAGFIQSEIKLGFASEIFDADAGLSTLPKLCATTRHEIRTCLKNLFENIAEA